MTVRAIAPAREMNGLYLAGTNRHTRHSPSSQLKIHRKISEHIGCACGSFGACRGSYSRPEGLLTVRSIR